MLKAISVILAVVGLAATIGSVGAQTGGKSLVCPVMKGAIKDKAKAPHLMVNNAPVYFCCPGCSDQVKKEPGRYLKSPIKDPVTGASFRVTAGTPKLEHRGALFLFSSARTRSAFQKSPGKYAHPGTPSHGGQHGT